jgi:hypothetical protein
LAVECCQISDRGEGSLHRSTDLPPASVGGAERLEALRDQGSGCGGLAAVAVFAAGPFQSRDDWRYAPPWSTGDRSGALFVFARQETGRLVLRRSSCLVSLVGRRCSGVRPRMQAAGEHARLARQAGPGRAPPEHV